MVLPVSMCREVVHSYWNPQQQCFTFLRLMKKQWLKYQVFLCRNKNKPSLNAKNGGGVNLFYWFHLQILYVLLFSIGYTVEMSNY